MTQLKFKTTIPWWLAIILFLEIWPMFLGPYFSLNNPTFMGGPEATSLSFGSFVHLARNIAVGLAFLIAIFLRNAPMLFILIFIRLITDLIDGPALIYLGIAENKIFVSSIFIFGYYIPAVIALKYLWKQITLDN